MLRRLEAPKTIASMLGCPHTHSNASRGGTAPEANTDIAMARNGRFSRVAVGLDAAGHPETELVDVGAHDRVLDADRVEASSSAGGSS